MGTLHIHLDESGDLRFTPTAKSRYYVFAAVWTYHPEELAADLEDLRFNLLKRGVQVERFHAADDSNWVRKQVMERIIRHSHWHFAATVVEKRKVPPSEWGENAWKFYARFVATPLRFVLQGTFLDQASRVLVYADSLPQQVRENRKTVRRVLKATCRRLGKGVPALVHHQAGSSNYWLQVADYCAWSVARKWELGDCSYYDRLWPRLEKAELNILAGQEVKYY